MRIVFDHCVPRTLRKGFPSHEIRTAREEGWDLLENGDLLDAAERAGFEVLLTTDGGFEHQQSMTGRKLGVLVVDTHPSTGKRLLGFAHEIEAELHSVQPGAIRVFKK